MAPGADVDIATIGTIVLSVASSTFLLVWRASREFTAIRDFVDSKVSKLIDKLEYHERHDDQRFGEIRDNIWELRLALKSDRLDKILQKNEDQENGNN